MDTGQSDYDNYSTEVPPFHVTLGFVNLTKILTSISPAPKRQTPKPATERAMTDGQVSSLHSVPAQDWCWDQG